MNKYLFDWLEALKSDSTPSIDECVECLGEWIPYLHLLKRTEQDPEWHAEGDVHIHTGMVLEELYGILESEASYIQGERRQALILGALLHDIAKPIATRRREIRGTERVVALGHESLGRSYLAFKLMEGNLAYSVVEMVLGLVGEHHMPKRLVVKDLGEGAYRALSRRADCELLYYLEVADMTGRICPDKPMQLEHLALFKMFCEEYGLWGSAEDAHADWKAFFRKELADMDKDVQDYIFANAMRDREMAWICVPEESIAKTFAYRDDFAKVVVMCGPSGSGKSSWIRSHLPEYQMVSLDEIREELSGDRANQSMRGQVMQEAKARFKHHLRSKDRVVWDATNLRIDFRKVILDLAYDYKALVTLVVFQKPETKFYEGNRQRPHAVPDEVVKKQIESLQWPVVDESHRYVVVGEDGVILRTYGCWDNRSNPFEE
ncbi:MAG: AAA family ATPase [Pseudomonadales bacterium]|nr:AAA family ATPase [Pseudomonadales bacterium]